MSNVNVIISFEESGQGGKRASASIDLDDLSRATSESLPAVLVELVGIVFDRFQKRSTHATETTRSFRVPGDWESHPDSLVRPTD